MGILTRLGAWDRRILGSRPLILLESLAVLLAAGAAHFALFSGTGLWTDNDSPYHHLLIAEIWKGGWWRDVTWLPYTILGEAGPDHHWLWHLLLSPFAAIDNLGLRVDVVNSFGFGLIAGVTNLALRLLGVHWAPCWVALMLGATPTPLLRWSQARAQDLAYVWLALFLVALDKRHRGALLLIPFLFMDSYHGAAMLVVPALLMFAVRRWREGAWDPWLLALPALGGALALVTSPWYPHDVEYFLFHTLDKVGNKLNLDVGNEWYPTTPQRTLAFLLPQAVLLGAVLVISARALRTSLAPITLVAAGTLVFMVAMTLQHVRFVEYCPQFLVITAALVARDSGALFVARLRPALAIAAVATAVMVFVSCLAMAKVHHAQHRELALNRLVPESRLLAEFVPPGSVVLNTQWTLFPYLAYRAPTLRYVSGLDPYYLAYGSAERFLALSQLTGRVALPEGSSVDVRAVFDTEWVLTDDPEIIRFLVATRQASAVMHEGIHFVGYLGRDPAVVERLRTQGSRWMDFVWPLAPGGADSK